MAYPTNKQTIKKNWANDTPVVNDHPNEHNLVAIIVEALQDKVGITNDTNINSIDFKLSDIPLGEKAETAGSSQVVQDNLTAHEENTANPHSVTKAQVGLGNVTNEAQVALTGDQTVAGVKTFSSSPIVPDPTTNTQAVNKQTMDSAISTAISEAAVETKQNVGLFTQGKFVDSFESEFKFNHEQGATYTALTGLSTTQSIDTLDGVNFVGAYGDANNVYFQEITLSGSAYTIVNTLAFSTFNATSTIVKLIDSTSALVAYNVSGGSDIYIAYFLKVGSVWVNISKDNIIQTPGTGYVPKDILIASATSFYVASVASNNVGISKAVLSAGIVSNDATFTDVIISVGSAVNAVFNNTSEIFVTSSTATVSKYSFSSGTSSIIGTTGTVTNVGTDIKVIADDSFVIQYNSRLYTYSFDGTTLELTSLTQTGVSISNSTLKTFYPTGTYYGIGARTVTTSTGSENSIEDITAQGHLGYIVSQSATLDTNTFDLVVSGSTGNNGTFTPTGTPTVNKVMITARPTSSGTQTCTISSSLPDRVNHIWKVKGSNYYLGLDA